MVDIVGPDHRVVGLLPADGKFISDTVGEGQGFGLPGEHTGRFSPGRKPSGILLPGVLSSGILPPGIPSPEILPPGIQYWIKLYGIIIKILIIPNRIFSQRN